MDASAPSSGPPAAARILVVDDEKVIREILAEFLQLEGYQVATCEDGQKALDELRLRAHLRELDRPLRRRRAGGGDGRQADDAGNLAADLAAHLLREEANAWQRTPWNLQVLQS